VLTAAHVLDDRTTATVFLPGLPRGTAGRLVLEDLHHDLALLSIKHVDAPAFALASDVRRGERVGVVGFPKSSWIADSETVAPKLNEGLVSCVDLIAGTVEYDALTDNGDSGGPIFDLATGELVGIVHGESKDVPGTYVGVTLSVIRALLLRI
jgi:S1-C subfamily serine protease